MCSCDFDGPEFFSKSTPKARKEHHCCECGRAIHSGEKYERHAGKWDGYFMEHVWCAHCSAAQAILAKRLDCPCWLYEDLWGESSLGGHIENGTDLRAWRLLVSARKRKWTIRRGPNAGQLMPLPALRPDDIPPKKHSAIDSALSSAREGRG